MVYSDRLQRYKEYKMWVCGKNLIPLIQNFNILTLFDLSLIQSFLIVVLSKSELRNQAPLPEKMIKISELWDLLKKEKRSHFLRVNLVKNLTLPLWIGYVTYVYTLLVWVGVCLFVCNKRQNGWTAGPNFVLDIAWPQGRVMNDQILKICV